MSAALARLKELQAKNSGKSPYRGNPQKVQKPFEHPFEPFEGRRGEHVWPDDGGGATTVESGKSPYLGNPQKPQKPFEPFEGERGGHVWPDGGAATAVESGKVPACYADAMARLSCQALPGIPQDWQSRAANMATMLLDLHGAALARLQWPVGAMFDTPVVLAVFGESAALDLRKAGLAWQMRQGDTITRLAPNGAVILRADGKSFAFQWRPAHGQK